MTKEERFAKRWAKAEPFPEWAIAAMDLPAPPTIKPTMTLEEWRAEIYAIADAMAALAEDESSLEEEARLIERSKELLRQRISKRRS